MNAASYQPSQYELQRLERIRKNEAYLDSLGLRQNKAKMLEMTKKTKHNQQRDKKLMVKPGEERRSQRKQKNTGGLMILSYTDPEDMASPTAIKQAAFFSGAEVTPSPKNLSKRFNAAPSRSFRRTSLNREEFALTDKEKDIISQSTMDSNYLQKFREFLVYHNKISEQNVRNVMKQVTKLATGEGVRYESPSYGWKPNQYFQKGTPVTPLSDFVELMEMAQECEDKWGRDHGNGWLLSHPLKKMLLFQQFCLQNPDFLSSECKLKEYYAQDFEEEEEEEVEVSDAAPAVTSTEEENSTSREEEQENRTSSEEEEENSSSSEEDASDEEDYGETNNNNKRSREDYAGRRVAKKFGRKVYQGTVKSYDEDSKFWKVVYDGGDEEDMEAEEVQETLKLLKEVEAKKKDGPQKRGRPKKKSRKA